MWMLSKAAVVRKVKAESWPGHLWEMTAEITGLK